MVPAGRSTGAQPVTRSGRPASRSSIVPSARRRRWRLATVPSRTHSRLRVPERGTRAVVSVPRISAIPTARRSRASGVSPLAARISSRNRRPVSGAGSVTVLSATSIGADGVPSAITRTRVAWRTPGTGSSVSVRIVCSAPLHSIQVVRPSRKAPSHGWGVPSNALEARKPGFPWKRAELVKPAGPPTRRSSASSGAVAAALAQPSTVYVRAVGGWKTRVMPVSPSRRSRTSAAPAGPRLGVRRNGSSPVVRWNRYVSAASGATERSAMVGGRSASRACSPSMRSSRIPPAPRRHARPACGSPRSGPSAS